jgi:hypothetical protein
VNKERKKVNEEQVNEELPEIILSGFAVVRDHDESTGKEEDVRIQEDDEEDDEEKMSEFRKMMIEEEDYSALGGFLHLSEPSGLETPSKYEY